MNSKRIEEILFEHKSELENKFSVTRIGFFGSYSRGEETQNSDIDIVVELSAPDLLLIIALKNYLQELLTANIDIVRYRDRMNDLLKKRIQRDVIYV